MTAERKTPDLPLTVIVLNYVPVIYLAALALFLYHFGNSPTAIVVCVLVWIYILPPLACRLVLLTSGMPQGPVTQESASFKKWWFLTQLQTLHNRFPALEEALRMIPTCYSLWLCLWGSKVSPFVLWSPGVRITDRYLLDIEKFAVLGWGAQLSPHLVTLDEHGQSRLTLGKIVIGQGSIIGGQSCLGPGSHVFPGESFPATRTLPPFNAFQNGRRVTRHQRGMNKKT